MPTAVQRTAQSDTAYEELPDACQGEAGTSTGINIAPGSEDDGWIVPDSVMINDGSRLQLYKDGEALHAAYDAIKSAKRRICLEVYIFASDDTGRAFAELLAAKAREGVRVYVIYDSLGSISSDRKMFGMMRSAGVNLQAFHPIRPWECRYSWRPANRDHRKLLLIDDDKAGLGGLNVGGEYAGSWVIPSSTAKCDLWRDNAMGVVGPSVKVFLQAFARSWKYVTRGGRIHNAEFHHGLDNAELGLLASVPTVNSPLRSFLVKTMHSARKSIIMTMAYFAPDDPLVNELQRAAIRGVRVRLMLPGRSDVPLVRIAARSFYESLLKHGIEIYERQGVVLHSKTMTVDGDTTIIGSANLDSRSIEYNCELSAVVRSREFGKQMHDLFENDVRFSQQINLAEWRRRPQWDRFVQWAVSRARYLM